MPRRRHRRQAGGAPPPSSLLPPASPDSSPLSGGRSGGGSRPWERRRPAGLARSTNEDAGLRPVRPAGRRRSQAIHGRAGSGISPSGPPSPRVNPPPDLPPGRGEERRRTLNCDRPGEVGRGVDRPRGPGGGVAVASVTPPHFRRHCRRAGGGPPPSPLLPPGRGEVGRGVDRLRGPGGGVAVVSAAPQHFRSGPPTQPPSWTGGGVRVGEPPPSLRKNFQLRPP